MGFLNKIQWFITLAVTFLVISLGCASIVTNKEPVCRSVQMRAEDTGKAYSVFMLPTDPELAFINDKTEWIPVVLIGPEGDYLVLATADIKDNSMYFFMLVQALNDKIIPIILTIEDQKRVEGQRFIKGWWYGGDGNKCPLSLSKDELVKRLKVRMGLPDGSI